jgi:acyl-coenzyme A thioesterase PaaI-like protein
VAARAAGSDTASVDDPVDLPRFVTASLHVDFLRPTPLGPELEVRGRATEVTARKVVVDARVLAGGEVTARGVVVAVQMPEAMSAR